MNGTHGEPRRADRVAERLRAELSDLLLRGRLRDPGAKNVLVSDVKLTDDLSQARVFLRTLDEADTRRRDRVVAAFERAAGFLRKELAPKLKLRRVPELEFFWDDLIDRAMRIEAILHETQSEASTSRKTRGAVTLAEAKEQAIELIRKAEHVLVSGHRRPDADALGSALGFAAIVRAMGKQATVWVPETLAPNLQFIPGEVVRDLPEGVRFDSTWIMDTASEKILPKGLPGEEVRGPLVIVDHHAAHDDAGDLIVRDIDACATAEVVMDLASMLDMRPVPREAASPLYAAIVADTGGFRYPVTTAASLRLGAELLEGGADPWQTAYELFEGWRPERLKLLGAILEQMEIDCEGRLAVLRVTRAMLEEHEATDDMVEGMVNYGRMLRGVEVALLLWEVRGDSGGLDTKVSLRSNGGADVSKVALALGGGGHRGAAGAQVAASVAEVEERAREHIRALWS